MAKIKLTKNELKTQRDSMARFQRYLPTLQLKKQQLQMEMRGLDQHQQDRGGHFPGPGVPADCHGARNHVQRFLRVVTFAVDADHYPLADSGRLGHFPGREKQTA